MQIKESKCSIKCRRFKPLRKSSPDKNTERTLEIPFADKAKSILKPIFDEYCKQFEARNFEKVISCSVLN
ncbi:hypothetical protein Y032_0002g1081 [Ancylostoma ceylanicum]|uniref:Uncharacterized protein n=1 Tax=Ancylostoma ceylanicum TaxID=53326 RepID=A0A016VYS5_9BILA|nr:hypothetical protein Y032_0002g1081 [Ancylostoma ceylanicum]